MQARIIFRKFLKGEKVEPRRDGLKEAEIRQKGVLLLLTSLLKKKESQTFAGGEGFFRLLGYILQVEYLPFTPSRAPSPSPWEVEQSR
ncbi:hypothetical protein MASR2M79_11180 [Aminivibrio sp.]